MVCGSHTTGATAQLAPVIDQWGTPIVVDTADALDDPDAAGNQAAERVLAHLDTRSFAVVMSERDRASEHNTLNHGERIMAALTTVVRGALPHVSVVVAKGGITSAEVARTGIGATSALVLGQVRAGVSVWQLEDRDGRDILYVVVPGNVGDPGSPHRDPRYAAPWHRDSGWKRTEFVKTALKAARTTRSPLLAFTCYTLETAIGVLEAAEAVNRPVILLVSDAAMRAAAGARLMTAMVALSQQARIPAWVQLDHCADVERIRQALDLGAGAVMADGYAWTTRRMPDSSSAPSRSPNHSARPSRPSWAASRVTKTSTSPRRRVP